MFLRLLLIASLLACPYCCKSGGAMAKDGQRPVACPCCAKNAAPPADTSNSSKLPSKAPMAVNCFCAGAVAAKTEVQLDKPAAASHAIVVAGGHIQFSFGEGANQDLPAGSRVQLGRDLRTLFVSLRC